MTDWVERSSKWFDTWNEAFDHCREVNKPIVVQIGEESTGEEGERACYFQVFPSGKSKMLY